MLLKKTRGRFTIKIRNATGLPMGVCKGIAATMVNCYVSALGVCCDHAAKVRNAGGSFVLIYRTSDGTFYNDDCTGAELHGPKGMFLIENAAMAAMHGV